MKINDGSKLIEKDFERYLLNLGYTFKYEQEVQGKFPDYHVYAGEKLLCICEVKYFEESEKTKQQMRECLGNEIDFIQYESHKRIKEKINQAEAQFPRKCAHPCVLVLSPCCEPVDEDDIINAFFGEIYYSVGMADKILRHHHHKGAKLRRDLCTRVSALSIFELVEPPQTKTYHNPFAIRKFRKEIFNGKNDKHFEAQFQNGVWSFSEVL